ncbi:AAA family ATPase [Oxalobacteraceae sp. CFBP 13730]|nr:AAA family ATPase [Oxalobacteraceae sp. CFBP 13730]
MLTNIEIRKFRSCRNVKLDHIDDLLVLIGRNGAGKTNILKAIEWACQFASSDLETTSASRNIKLIEGDVGLTFQDGPVRYRYELKQETTHYLDEKSEAESRLSVVEKLYICQDGQQDLFLHRIDEHIQLFNLQSGIPSNVGTSLSSSSLSTLLAIFPESDYFSVIASSVKKLLSSVRYYPLHNFDENIRSPYILSAEYKKWTSNRTDDPNSVNSALCKIIEIYLNNKDSFNELSDLMGNATLDLIDSIDVTEFDLSSDPLDINKERNSLFIIHFVKLIQGKKRRFSFSDLSFGTKRILFLLIALVYDNSSVALLEQPEDGVHTGLVSKLATLFRSYAHRSQFIIASHSTTLLNRANPREVYFISNADGFTEARSLSSGEVVAAELFLRNEGPLSEFLQLIGDD